MSRRVTSERFIGRQEELSRIRRLIDAVAGGEHATLLIGGDAGVGKTRLLAECLTIAKSAGFRTMTGRCATFGAEVLPYAPIVEAFRELALAASRDELDAALGTADSELVRLVPSLRVDAEPPTGEPNRSWLFEQALGLLRKLSESRPTLLAIEDLHWADHSTLALLAFVAQRIGARPLLIVETFRSDELHRGHPLQPWLAEIERSVRPERLDLSPFTLEELREIISEVSEGEFNEDRVADVFSRSGGNAFFAEELIAAGSATGEVPASLRDAVLTRLRDVPEGVLGLLRIASATQARIDPHALARIAERPVAEIETAMYRLVEQGILVTDGVRLRMRHDLMREVLYNELLPGEKTRVHQQWADALSTAQGHGELVMGELAHHWRATGNHDEALRASVAAGREAVALAAPAEGERHFEHALEIWSQSADPEAISGVSRGRLVSLYAATAYDAGGLDRPVALLRSEIEAGDHTKSDLALLHIQLSFCLWPAGDPEAYQVASQAVELIDEHTEPRDRARILSMYCRMAALAGGYREAEQLIPAARKAAELAGEELLLIEIDNSHGVCLLGLGLAGSKDVLRDAHDRALASGEARGIQRAKMNYSDALFATGEPERAVEISTSGIEHAASARLGTPFSAMQATNLTSALYRLGQWDEALAVGQKYAQHIRRQGWISGLTQAYAPLLFNMGHVAEAKELLEYVWAEYRVNPINFESLHINGATLVRIAAMEGRFDDARTLTEQTLDAFAEVSVQFVPLIVAHGVRAAADAALAARFSGANPEEHTSYAADLYDRMLAIVADTEVSEPHHLALMESYAALTAVELDRASGTATPQQWDVLADSWCDLFTPDELAYAQYRHAESLVPVDRGAATEALAVAFHTANGLGYELVLDELASLATRARLDLPEPEVPEATDEESTDPFGLTSRERDVLALVAMGKTNKQIAADLFISAKTAGNHVSNILTKMDVRNRGEAAAAAHYLGLFPNQR